MYNSPAAHLNRHYTINTFAGSISSKSNSPKKFKRSRSSELESYVSKYSTNSNNSNFINNVSKITPSSGLDLSSPFKKTKYSSRDHNTSDEVSPEPQENWFRIVKFDAINSLSDKLISSSQFRKIVHKAHNQQTSDVTKSMAQPIWHRTVKCVTPQASLSTTVMPSPSSRVKQELTHNQLSTTDGHQSHHRRISSTNISGMDSQNKSTSSTPMTDRPSEIAHLSSRSSSSHSLGALPMSFTDPFSEYSSIVNSTHIQPSEPSNIVYSNRAQIIIDLDELAPDGYELQPNGSHTQHSTSSNPVNHTARSMPPAQSISPTSDSSESETLEVVVRSRNNADFSVVINNPDIIRMHKILQRHLSISSNLNMPSNNPNLFYHVNNYMQVLRSAVLSSEQNNSDITSILNTSIPQLLTFDQSSYSLIEKSSIMPPVNRVYRIQNGILFCYLK